MIAIWILWPFMINPPEGAKTSVYLATTEKPEKTDGKYYTFAIFRKNLYETDGNALVCDEELQEHLWRRSEELIGEEFIVERTKENVLV